MKEIWKDIKDYEGLYQVSNLGRIKRLEHKIPTKLKNQEYITLKERIIKPVKNPNKYTKVYLKGKQKLIHRLVAEAFLPNPNNYPCINHKNEIKDDNMMDNLEWCSYKYNNNYNNKGDRIAKSKWKVICQYDTNMNLIKEWASIKEASDNMNIEHSNIIACCKGRQKTSYGFIWRYKEANING